MKPVEEARATPSVPAPEVSTARPEIALLLSVVFLAYLAQMTLNPIIAPLSREVGLAEWQIGATISIAAFMLVLTSQFWGRRSQSWGRKPVLVAAFTLAMVTMSLFALLAWLGMIGMIAGIELFLLFVLLRGIGFGTAISAVQPTAQAYIADVTSDETARVKGMAGVGAVQGIAMIAGAVVGGVLAVFDILAPLIAVPVLLAGGLILVAVRLRREPRHRLVEKPRPVSPFDARVWPFLLAGFGMYMALGFIQVLLGFVVQDRLGADAETTGLLTGGALLLAGLGLIVAQAVVVPRSGWRPATLLRVGGAIAFVGFTLLIPDAGLALLLASILVIGFGLGIATPGFTAGPTLMVGRDEQGGLAGLTTATAGLTFVIAPTASTALYGLGTAIPIVVGTAIMAVVTIFVLVHPRFRRLAVPASEPPPA